MRFACILALLLSYYSCAHAQTAHEVKPNTAAGGAFVWEWNSQRSAPQADFRNADLVGRLVVKVKNGDTVDFSGPIFHGVVFEQAKVEMDALVWKIAAPSDALVNLGAGFGSFYDAVNARRTKDNVNGRYAKIEILNLHPGKENAIKFTCRVHSKSGDATRLMMLGAIVLDESTPIDGGNSLLSRVHMPSAMVVPSCTGGNFLVGLDSANRTRLLGIPLFDSDSAVTAKTVTAMGNLQWKEKVEQIEVGKEIQWVNGAGSHGLRIKNWDAVKGSVEVIEVHGLKDSFLANGRNSQPSSANGTMFARFKIMSMPVGTDTIEYNCIIHNEAMTGTVKIVAAEVPVDTVSDEDTLKQLENDWAMAVATNDPKKIAAFFTEAFLFVGASGILQDRVQHLEDFASGKLKITSVTPSAITIHVYGDNKAAVVSSTVAVVGTFGDRDITGNYQFTDTLVKIAGRWLAAARQQTPKR